jgi:NADH:ubiquinone oxidoreductase subunit 5 (subunit L)/multisubunit Na+/H+ antiporter MnhA subunit
MGLVQRDPKVVLGYSSIAKMGVVTLGYGVALAAPEAAPAMLAAVTFYAVNHLVLKGALFLGVDLPRQGSSRPWALGGLVVLSAALAGAPLTGGAAAKAAVSGALPQDWTWLAGWLAVATLASTLLMARLLYLVSVESPPTPARGPTAWTAWGALILVVMMLPIAFGEPATSTYGWPAVASGAAVAGAVVVLRPRWPSLLVGRVPPGDVLYLAPRGFRIGVRAAVSMAHAASATSGVLRESLSKFAHAWNRQWGFASSAPIPWPVAGAIWLTLSGLLLAGLIAGAG